MKQFEDIFPKILFAKEEMGLPHNDPISFISFVVSGMGTEVSLF
jgi:hypothetical protein